MESEGIYASVRKEEDIHTDAADTDLSLVFRAELCETSLTTLRTQGSGPAPSVIRPPCEDANATAV